MSTLHRIMQQELEAIDRRMEHLAAERAKIVEAISILESVPPQVVGAEVSEHVHMH